MAKEGKGYNQSMFTNKDGYLTGGDKVTVKGTGKARKQTATWY